LLSVSLIRLTVLEIVRSHAPYVDSAASSDFLAVSVTTVCAILLLATGLDVKLVGSFGLEEALGGP